MSQHIKHATATLAAAACLAFASTVPAAGLADNYQTVAADSPTAICHPAYRQCVKEAPKPVTAGSASDETTYLLRGVFEHVPFGSSCHPAYRPCPGWSYWTQNYPVATRTN